MPSHSLKSSSALPVKMPALTLPTASSNSVVDVEDAAADRDSESPKGPPYSPITPVMSNSLPSQGSQDSSSPAEPSPIPPLEPFSESDSPDAIALRSALSILQIQRQQTLRDLTALERQKKVATADPEGFSRAIVEGKVKTRSSGVLGSQPGFDASYLRNAGDSDDEEKESDTEVRRHPRTEKFENVPGPQNVVRCPPINWAKYHVVGGPLDNLHEEQRRRPLNNPTSSNEPQARAEEHVVAAPYNPLREQLVVTGNRRQGNGASGG